MLQRVVNCFQYMIKGDIQVYENLLLANRARGTMKFEQGGRVFSEEQVLALGRPHLKEAAAENSVSNVNDHAGTKMQERNERQAFIPGYPFSRYMATQSRHVPPSQKGAENKSTGT